jgi:hypothetical protein
MFSFRSLFGQRENIDRAETSFEEKRSLEEFYELVVRSLSSSLLGVSVAGIVLLPPKSHLSIIFLKT